MDIEEYNRFINLNDNNILKVPIKNLPNLLELLNLLENFNVSFSECGLSTHRISKMKLGLFVDTYINSKSSEQNSKYIFHNILTDELMYPLITRLIPPLKTTDMRVSRLYIGCKGTGSHIHNHSVAINFLISGKKQWIIFPHTSKNTKFLEDNNMGYGNIKEEPYEWFLKNKSRLLENLEDVTLIVQNKGEVINIPSNFYHGVYNLTKVCGVTYSWFS